MGFGRMTILAYASMPLDCFRKIVTLDVADASFCVEPCRVDLSGVGLTDCITTCYDSFIGARNEKGPEIAMPVLSAERKPFKWPTHNLAIGRATTLQSAA